jgi:hypothetical protein
LKDQAILGKPSYSKNEQQKKSKITADDNGERYLRTLTWL